MSLNGWLYVNGNPVNLTDPTGQFADYREICEDWGQCYAIGTGRKVSTGDGDSSGSGRNGGRGGDEENETPRTPIVDNPPGEYPTPNPYDSGPLGTIAYQLAQEDMNPECLFGAVRNFCDQNPNAPWCQQRGGGDANGVLPYDFDVDDFLDYYKKELNRGKYDNLDDNIYCETWDCVSRLMFHALLWEEKAVITGPGVTLLSEDPVLLNFQEDLISLAKSDPGYGFESFPFSDYDAITFGEFGGNKWAQAKNPATWMVRLANVSANGYVSQSGVISITFEVSDTLDLHPDWKNLERWKSGYNIATTILGPLWHGLLGARDLETSATWTIVIDEINNVY